MKTWISGGKGVGVMELGSEDRDLADNAPVIEKIGAPSIAQIEKLIGGCKKQRIFSNLSGSEFSER